LKESAFDSNEDAEAFKSLKLWMASVDTGRIQVHKKAHEGSIVIG
jgi:hypothetical protein